MKIAGFLIVGENESERYLPKVLERLESLCDEIFIWGNAPDRETDKLCEKYAYHRHPEDIWGKAQWRIKYTHLTRNVAPYKPDWIICVDADEILDKRFTREKAEELAQREEIAYEFYCVQLWDNEQTMRVDGGWGKFWNVRYYKFMPELNLRFQNSPLHCGLAPKYAYRWRTPSGFLFKHYGYLKEEDRKKKWERYQKFDPQMKYRTPEWYKSILEKPELKPFNEETFGEKLRYKPKQPLLKKVLRDKIMAKKGYIIRNPHGRLVDVNEDTYDTIKDKKGFELVSEMEATKMEEVPIIEPNIIDETTCSICGFKAKTKSGLRLHKRKHEKET